MVKKGMVVISAAIAAACLFNGCADRNREEPDWQITEQSQATASEEEPAHIETTLQTTASESADNHMETDIKNLTETSTQGICIDYAINSYENVQRFGQELFAQNIHDKNPVLSPVSAYLALSMAGCGADGATWEEFYNVLGDMEVFADDMINSLPQNGDLMKLSFANSAWIDDEFIVEDNWLGTIKSLMHAEAFQTDLSTEEAMSSMNSWIADKTNGLIDKMLDASVDGMTNLVLFDTVYFKGKWEMPFEAENTHQEDFYIQKAQNITEQVDMMNMYMTQLDYIANDFAEGVILPYQNNAEEAGYKNAKMAFIALKPTNSGDIRDIYSKLTVDTDDTIEKMLLGKQNEMVNLKLPKFDITFDRELNKSLSNMGLTVCFDQENADFSRIGKTQSDDNLYISLVRQKAKIIVDEEGTEAAAVTEIDMRDGGAMRLEPPRELYFNEPFLYMIMDMDREIPLFIGILDNPKGE